MEQNSDLIPDLPQWFKNYLTSLPDAEAKELATWIADNEGSAVLDTLLEAIVERR